MSDFTMLCATAVAILLLSAFSVIYTYRKYRNHKQDIVAKALAFTPSFFGMLMSVMLLFPIYSEYEKVEHLKEFSEGKRVFWCPENKESQKMNKVALSDGFIYDSDKDMFINHNTGVAYSFNVAGRVCR